MVTRQVCSPGWFVGAWLGVCRRATYLCVCSEQNLNQLDSSIPIKIAQLLCARVLSIRGLPVEAQSFIYILKHSNARLIIGNTNFKGPTQTRKGAVNSLTQLNPSGGATLTFFALPIKSLVCKTFAGTGICFLNFTSATNEVKSPSRMVIRLLISYWENSPL